MNFSCTTLRDCSTLTGVVVVIDVIRAFSTAGYAFEAGAESIELVGDVDEAFRIRDANPEVQIMGEVGGVKVQGFDYGNSPAEFFGRDLRGVRLVQRTSAGTQGVVQARDASVLLAASFCCAQATVAYIQKLTPQKVSFVVTGITEDGRGDEDAACADYLAARLIGERPDPFGYLERVRSSKNAGLLAGALQVPGDVGYCTALDRFDFAMPVFRENGRLVMRKVNPGVGEGA